MTKQQRLVLVVSILASFVAFLDSAIVNVALPSIQNELGGGLSAQQWIVDAYLLTLGSVILIAGSLSDLFGRMKILSIGLLGFGVASVLCAIAPNNEFLIAARALQGIAGAFLVPSSLALIIAAFSGSAQGKAIGTWTAWTGIAFVIGPLLGGILVDSGSWRWIFAINILPIIVTLWLIRDIKVVKEKPKSASVDYLGATLCALGLAGPIYALIEAPHYGWSSPMVYLPLICGILLLALFLLHEKRTKHPMLPLSLFKNHNFSVGNIATLAIYAALSAATFLIVLFLQQVSGYSALSAGLALLPITIILFFLSSRFGALAGKHGPRLFMGLGPLVAALGFLLMLRIPADVNYWTQLFPAIILFGLGLAMTVAPLTSAILGDVKPEQAGIASAVNNAVARIAGLIAVAAIGAAVAVKFSYSMNEPALSFSNSSIETAKQSPLVVAPPKPYTDNKTYRAALTNASVDAFHTGIAISTATLIAGGIISLVGIRNPKTAD